MARDMPNLSPTIELKDTLTGQLRRLDSRVQKSVKVYVCGLTVQDVAHIGHAKTIVFFDVLRRVMEAKGFDVVLAQNFTDVDDKVIERARRLGVKPLELAEKNIERYFSDFGQMNLRGATYYPRATENVGEMISFIEGLMRKGYAYRASTGVYFDVSRFDGYGKLSKVSPSELKVGARVEPDPAKRNPYDFALWKFSEEEPSWESPWGRGRPGWHIECSAMVHRYLGEPLDVHGGGEDLIFPHHENEIAQTESLTGKPLAHIWMHVGMLNLAEEKMSKSLGNIIGVREAASKWGPNTLRYFLISNRYRNQLPFTEEAITNSSYNWSIIEGAAYGLRSPDGREDDVEEGELREMIEAFDRALSDDMDTPSALSELVKASRMISRLSSQGKLGALAASKVRPYFDLMFDTLGFRLPSLSKEELAEVQSLVSQRAALRASGRYSEADDIRRRLAERGIKLQDRPGGTVWMKVENPWL